MQKVILILVLVSTLFAGNMRQDLVNKVKFFDSINTNKICLQYRFDSERFLKKADAEYNNEIRNRYFFIANKLADNYGQCIKANTNFNAYRANPYNYK